MGRIEDDPCGMCHRGTAGLGSPSPCPVSHRTGVRRTVPSSRRGCPRTGRGVSCLSNQNMRRMTPGPAPAGKRSRSLRSPFPVAPVVAADSDLPWADHELAETRSGGEHLRQLAGVPLMVHVPPPASISSWNTYLRMNRSWTFRFSRRISAEIARKQQAGDTGQDQHGERCGDAEPEPGVPSSPVPRAGVAGRAR